MAAGLPADYAKYLVGNYAPLPPTMVRGKGARLYDRQGRDYVDFGSGVAVSALGHGHARLACALAEQAGKLIHLSNVFVHDKTVRTARKLVSATGMEQVFFCNSGAEANECALKMARKRGVAINKRKFKVLSLQGSFHGRLGLALAASGQAKLWRDFGPQPPGFIHAGHDPAALRRAFSKEVCAAIVEPIQGESGLRRVPVDTLRALQRLCHENDALLIADEIQTGMGRTGKLLCAPPWLAPDIVTMGKGLGGGFPVAATLVARKATDLLKPGDHGSTYGGNALAMVAVEVVLGQVSQPAFLARVRKSASCLRERLRDMRKAGAPIRGLRGAGLLCGIEIDPDRAQNTEIARRAMAAGVLVVTAGENVLRILPPLNVTQRELELGCRRLAQALMPNPRPGQ